SPVEGTDHESELFENGCIDRNRKGLIINPNCLKWMYRSRVVETDHESELFENGCIVPCARD
ncbi:unnamed protein product, partial [Sphenostylis stenocarpa]